MSTYFFSGYRDNIPSGDIVLSGHRCFIKDRTIFWYCVGDVLTNWLHFGISREAKHTFSNDLCSAWRHMIKSLGPWWFLCDGQHQLEIVSIFNNMNTCTDLSKYTSGISSRIMAEHFESVGTFYNQTTPWL